MNKIASYLRSHLDGEVFDSQKIREYFSTDASVLHMQPSLVVYPRTTNDVRKIARFSWQLAEKGHILPVTARGSGTDQTGAAVGNGIVLAFPVHLNKILELDSQQKLVRVQPGVNFKTLQDTLRTHGLFIPSFPTSYAYSTVGGAIANNTAGEKALKYGSLVNWVDKLEVVLANGELIQTGRLNRREVEKKKGLTTMEGDLYRAVDGVLTEHDTALDEYYERLLVSKDGVGYNLGDVRRKDGSVDLTPLFVGSQGTLGIVTEAILKAAPYEPHAEVVVASFDTLDEMIQAAGIIRSYDASLLEVIDKNLIEFVQREQTVLFPTELVGDVPPAAMLFAEFDDLSAKVRQKKVKKVLKALAPLTDRVVTESGVEEQEKLWSLRHSSALAIIYNQDGKTAVPVIEDAVVPFERLQDLFEVIYGLFEKHHLKAVVWGHAGDANLHIYPLLDLQKTGDCQKVFRLMDEYYRAVLELGGTIAGEHNDGRLRAPFVKLQVGDEMTTVFSEIKQAFDPYAILNPGVKTGTEVKELVSLLRKEYSLTHLLEYLPRT